MFNSYERDIVKIQYLKGAETATLLGTPRALFYRFCYCFSLKDYHLFRSNIIGKVSIKSFPGADAIKVNKREFLIACCEEEIKHFLSSTSCEKEKEKLVFLFGELRRALTVDRYTLFYGVFSDIVDMLVYSPDVKKHPRAEEMLFALVNAALYLKPKRG